MTEDQIFADFSCCPYFCAVANGTTALFLALQELNLKNRKVLLPRNACMNVAIAAKEAGCRPVFIDIDTETLDLNHQQLCEHLDDAAGIILIHNFGFHPNLETIKIIQSHNISVIEDRCLNYFVECQYKDYLRAPDAIIISTGGGKPIGTYYGARIFLREKSLFNKVSEANKVLPCISDVSFARIETLSKRHTAFYNKHFPALGWGSILASAITKYATSFIFNYRPRQITEDQYLSARLEINQQKISYRKIRNMLCQRSDLSIPMLTKFDTPWKIIGFIQNGEPVARQLRRLGFNASSWHHDLGYFWRDVKIKPDFERSIFNLEIVNYDLSELNKIRKVFYSC